MLYGYPEEVATAENWLHDCLCQMLRSIHTNLRTGELPVPWPEVIPGDYRDTLSKRTGLRDRLDAYIKALRRLNSINQNRVLTALNDQNEISLLLSCARECEAISDLPQTIRKPITELFRFAFGLLSGLDIRERHYSKIYHVREDHVCPFCGCERFAAPAGPREALDHYLSESKYPFAAANLRNLVPMGHNCNSKYKLAQDILRSDRGRRRRAIDPYNHIGIRISLENSQPFAGTNGRLPRWQIEFNPNTEEVITWEHVFHIRERYGRDELDSSFEKWLWEFSSWCRSANVAYESDQSLVDTIEKYATYLEEMGLNDRAFLKSAVFQMLHKHCQRGDQRLLDIFKDLVRGVKV